MADTTNTKEAPQINALNRKYFNTTMNYTLALLNAFDHLYYYTQVLNNNEYLTDKAHKIPISYGNYEKSIELKDLTESDITSGNFNFVPRLILSFDSLTKAPERQTQKYQRFKKRIIHPENDRYVLDMSYNSIAYDFHYHLLLQARGMTMATQLMEQILKFFNPSMNLTLQEYPIFTELTNTQILLSADPEFEIIEEFEDTQVNLINITFPLTIRGNIYSDLDYQAPIEVIEMFIHVWDEFNYQQSKMGLYYKLDLDNHSLPEKERSRYYDGTIPYTDDVKLPLDQMQEKRPDFIPPELTNDLTE